jgi:hypothetical protein
MNMLQYADYNHRQIIKSAIIHLAKFGEADGRIRTVAALPLPFDVIMDQVYSVQGKCPSIIKPADVDQFRTLLHLARRKMPSTPQDDSPYNVNRIAVKLDIEKSLGVVPGRMAYPKPNGGNRILPSIYNQLRKWWMRANGVCQEPHEMNDGHLDNTLTLLRESHGNVIARSTELLGKMANHFRNQPDIVAKLEALCLEMQKVDVDDMYPVFTILAKELDTRQSIPIVSGVNLDWLNDGSLEWDNK